MGGSITPPVFFNGPNIGATIGTQFTAFLYYAFGTVADPVNNTTAAGIMSPVSGSFTEIASSPVLAGGIVSDGTAVQIPGYTSSTPISFEIVYTGTVGGNAYTGRGGAWTESSINVLGQGVTSFGSNDRPRAFICGRSGSGTHHAGLGRFGRSGLARGVPPQTGLIGPLFCLFFVSQEPLFGAALFFW